MTTDEKLVIVSVLNISNPQHLDSDSGYITQELFGRELLRQKHQFILIAPIINQPRVPCYYLKLGNSKYEVRFGFPYSEFRKILGQIWKKYGHIDWIWVNQPEILTAIYAVKHELGFNDTRIFTYIHYLPILEFSEETRHWIWDPSLNGGQLALPIMRRIAEGCQLADIIGIHSQFGKNMLNKVADGIGMPLRCEKIRVIPTATDPLFLTDKIQAPPLKKSILFGYPNRLYAHYGTSEIFTNFEQLCTKWNAKVWITNPTHNRSQDRKRLDPNSSVLEKNILTRDFVINFDDVPSRLKYRSLLVQSHLIFGPNRKAALWSLCLIDGMGMGIPSLAPNYGAFKEMLPAQCLYLDFPEMDYKIQQLLENEDFWMKNASECFFRAQKYLPFHQVTYLESILWRAKDHGQCEVSDGRTVIFS